MQTLPRHYLDSAIGKPLADRLIESGTKFWVLEADESYQDCSPLTLPDNVLNALGVYNRGTRAAYFKPATLLRSDFLVVVAHEAGHALDHLATGTYSGYLSYTSPWVRAFGSPGSRFVSFYAATGPDEWFAESFRAFCNQSAPGFPGDRVVLHALDPKGEQMVLEALSLVGVKP